MAIQYTPQFIQTDLGMSQGLLDRQQAIYDQAFNNRLQFEDKFASLDVDPNDIELKNEVMGEVQGRVNEVVDRYGGDYAAASKDLARIVSKEKHNPFFGLASERRRLAEEERQMKNKLGINYIEGRSVRDVPLRDEQGNWIGADELRGKFWDRSQLQGRLRSEFGDLSKQVNEKNWRRLREFGLIEKDQIRGIEQSEVEGLASIMAQSLIDADPELSPEIAKEIALNEAQGYVLGTTSKSMQDPTLVDRGGSGGKEERPPFYAGYDGKSETSSAFAIREKSDGVKRANRTIYNIGRVLNKLPGADLDANLESTKSGYTPQEAASYSDNPSTQEYQEARANGQATVGQFAKSAGSQVGTFFKNAVTGLGNIIGLVTADQPGGYNAHSANQKNIYNRLQNETFSDESQSMLDLALTLDPTLNLITNEDGLLDFPKRTGFAIFGGSDPERDNKAMLEATRTIQSILQDDSKLEELAKKASKEREDYVTDNPIMKTLSESFEDQGLDSFEAFEMAAEMYEEAKIGLSSKFEMDFDILGGKDFDKNLANKMISRLGEISGDMIVSKSKSFGRGRKTEVSDIDTDEFRNVLAKNSTSIHGVYLTPYNGNMRVTISSKDGGVENYDIDIFESNLMHAGAKKEFKRISDFIGIKESFKDASFANGEYPEIKTFDATYIMLPTFSNTGTMQLSIHKKTDKGYVPAENEFIQKTNSFVNTSLNLTPRT